MTSPDVLSFFLIILKNDERTNSGVSRTNSKRVVQDMEEGSAIHVQHTQLV